MTKIINNESQAAQDGLSAESLNLLDTETGNRIVNSVQKLEVVVLALTMGLAACGGGGISGDTGSDGSGRPVAESGSPLVKQQVLENVGFFMPRGVASELVDQTSFGMLNANNVDQVRSSLERAKGAKYKVIIDFGPLIAVPVKKDQVQSNYTDRSGVRKTKVLEPLDNPKVLRFLSDDQLNQVLNPFFEIMAQYPEQVGTIFVADEPYLNGISKTEMERVGRLIRGILNEKKLGFIKMGVIFSSAMFNSSYAIMVSEDHSEYVKSIDEYYQRASVSDIEQERMDAELVRQNRLTTYDKAGNLFTDGGLPDGYEVVGFDFYISTLLQDAVQTRSLAWLADWFSHQSCDQFKNLEMREIRSKLSFFKDGPVGDTPEAIKAREADKALLDDMFTCRTNSISKMLKAKIAERNIQMILISESGSNGLLEFDAQGNIEQGQPSALVESRVKDEVVRALNFYESNKGDFSAGLMFFTYDNEFDDTIGLAIGGASQMPTVLDAILKYTRNES